LDDAMARLIEGPCPVSPQDLADTYRAASARIRSAGTFAEPLYPGARDAMLGLSMAGCVLGIATGKSLRGVRDTLDRHDLGHLFTTFQTSDIPPGKPHPDMLWRAMRETGAEARATVMVGDTTYDIEMARAAGTYAIGVSWGYHDAAALVAAGAHRIIERYSELGPAVRETLSPPPRRESDQREVS
jgi:phosphoglycolate phosphatase